MPTKASEDPQQQLAFDNGEKVIKLKHKKAKITNVETWTNAFLIFNYQCFHGQFPDKTQQLLRYINIVRTEASRSSSSSCLDYDIQFRLKLSRNPLLPWETVDALWLLYVVQSPQTQANPTQKSLKCFDYNYKGTCLRPYCSYQHSCIKCSNPHPVQSCEYSPQPSNSPYHYEKPRPNPQQLLAPYLKWKDI